MNIKYDLVKTEHNLSDGKRILFVGDIHGHYSDFMRALERKQFDPSNDIVYSTGDLIDRGSESISCLKLLLESWFKGTLGNHDLFLLAYLLTGENPDSYIAQIWHSQRSGGSWYPNLPEKDKDVVRELAKTLILQPVAREVSVTSSMFERTRFGVVHAEVPNDNWDFVTMNDKRQNHIDIITESREKIKQFTQQPHKRISSVRNIDYVICGHSIVKRPTAIRNQIYLDTGSYRPDGRITIASSDELLSVMRANGR